MSADIINIHEYMRTSEERTRGYVKRLLDNPEVQALIGRNTTPAEDLARATAAYDPYQRERQRHFYSIKLGAGDPNEGMRPCDSGDEPA